MNIPGSHDGGPDFVKGATGLDQPYNVTALGIGLPPTYLAQGGKSSSSSSSGAGTTFPTSPTDGQEYVYVADGTNGVLWQFRWYATNSWWGFIGGPPLYAEVTTGETTASATYAALSTAGPSIAVPFAGDFQVEIGCWVSTAAGSQVGRMSYDIGGTGAVDADAIEASGSSAAAIYDYITVSRRRRKTGLTAVTLTAKYLSDGTHNATFKNRWMAITPIKK